VSFTDVHICSVRAANLIRGCELQGCSPGHLAVMITAVRRNAVLE
jgi:hypothetical protein